MQMESLSVLVTGFDDATAHSLTSFIRRLCFLQILTEDRFGKCGNLEFAEPDRQVWAASVGDDVRCARMARSAS
jgi:hypothetical protein